MFSKGSSSGISISANGSNPCTPEDTHGKELSSSWKEENDLYEQEKDIFDDDKDDTITVSG